MKKTIGVSGHYRKINGKKVWIKNYKKKVNFSATPRSNKRMKWYPCPDCGGRIYAHRPEAHICEKNYGAKPKKGKKIATVEFGGDNFEIREPPYIERDSFGFEVDPYGLREEEEEYAEQARREMKAIQDEYAEEPLSIPGKELAKRVSKKLGRKVTEREIEKTTYANPFTGEDMDYDEDVEEAIEDVFEEEQKKREKKDRGAKPKVMIKLSDKEKDKLGITFDMPEDKRRKILREKAKKYGERSIAGKLRAIQVLNKNRNPELSKKAAEDAKYIFGAFEGKKFVGKDKGFVKNRGAYRPDKEGGDMYLSGNDDDVFCSYCSRYYDGTKHSTCPRCREAKKKKNWRVVEGFDK